MARVPALLKWIGNKQRFADTIISYFPDTFNDYYEPFWEEFVGEGTYESEMKWRSWGLEVAEFTGSGDIDFEP